MSALSFEQRGKERKICGKRFRCAGEMTGFIAGAERKLSSEAEGRQLFWKREKGMGTVCWRGGSGEGGFTLGSLQEAGGQTFVGEGKESVSHGLRGGGGKISGSLQRSVNPFACRGVKRVRTGEKTQP